MTREEKKQKIANIVGSAIDGYSPYEYHLKVAEEILSAISEENENEENEYTEDGVRYEAEEEHCIECDFIPMRRVSGFSTKTAP